MTSNTNNVTDIMKNLQPLIPLDSEEDINQTWDNLLTLPPCPESRPPRGPQFTDEEFQVAVNWLKTNYEDQLPVFADMNKRHFLRSPSGVQYGSWDWTGMYISDRRRLLHCKPTEYSRILNHVASFVLYHGEHQDEIFRMPRHSYYDYIMMVKNFHDGKVVPDFKKE
tara:strand:- start:155 stop:655 length:501 start_codon:yes stop_codon:yes gene_type:complete